MNHNSRMAEYRRRRNDVMVDFDGTLSEFQYPDIGPPIPGARDFLHELKRMGMFIVIYTARMSPAFRTQEERWAMYDSLRNWLRDNEMPFDEIDFGDEGKRVAMVYVDDRGAAAGPDVPWYETLRRVREIKKREDERWDQHG